MIAARDLLDAKNILNDTFKGSFEYRPAGRFTREEVLTGLSAVDTDLDPLTTASALRYAATEHLGTIGIESAAVLEQTARKIEKEFFKGFRETEYGGRSSGYFERMEN